jgi:hypothetical protein
MRYNEEQMKSDPRVPRRYQRSGWMAFDTLHQQHGPVQPTKAEALKDVRRLEGLADLAEGLRHALLVKGVQQ